MKRRFPTRRGTASAAMAIILAALLGLTSRPWELAGQETTPAEELSSHAKYLASPALEGRGVDSAGIKLARDYIAAEFTKYGLRPGGESGGYLQRFEVAVGVKVKAPTSLALDREPPLALNDRWVPLGLSATGQVEGEVVFVGYGISAKEYGYDDYAGVDVKGKTVVVLRYEPPPKNDQSPFRKSPDYSTHAALRTKANNARDHGAVGMILVDLDGRGDGKTELLSLRSSLWRSGNTLVAAQITRQMAESWFADHGAALMELKARIDRDEQPASRPLAGARISLQVNLEEERAPAENVVGILPGKAPQEQQEYLVIGAHYDHLGLGHFGTLDQRTAGMIHPGADDNASGTAVLLQVARRLSQIEPKPARGIIFVAFSAEELGLHGSRHFVSQWPQLSAIKSMINLDMVGRLRDDRITVFGTRSAPPFEAIVADAARQLELKLNPADGVGPSDHQSFYNKQIPVLHFFTGSHSDYHRPGDTWDKLNLAGMGRIADLVIASALAIAALPQAPQFTSLPSRPPSAESGERRLGGVYLGVIPEYSRNVDGVLLAGVAPGSPAAAAGLREGDVIIQMAQRKISNIEDLTDALASHKPADQVTIMVQRGATNAALQTTLGARR